MAYMSTVVTYGRGLGVACATGMNTEVGKIAQAISAVDTSTTPLQKKLDNLGKKLGLVIILISVVVFVVGLMRPHQGILDVFMTAIALAVAAIPEGLPAVVTVVLALGMTRMSKKMQLSASSLLLKHSVQQPSSAPIKPVLSLKTR